jgi:deferrochelatase/peroxidase EfeB
MAVWLTSSESLLRRRRRWYRAVGVTALVAGILVGLPPAPASAHDVSGVGATDFHTTVLTFTPAVPGVTLTVIENGSRLQVANTTSTDLVIDGYSGEPYARIGPAGAYVNDNSPATYLDTDRFSLAAVPTSLDPTKPAQWRRVSTHPVLAWHDHRTHWMLLVLPPSVADDPGSPHHISSWALTMHYGGRLLTATGSLDWLPGPSPWPWFLVVAAVAAVIAAAAASRRPYRVAALACVVVVVGQAVHGAGIAFAVVGSVWQQWGSVFAFDAPLVWPFALFAAYLLHRRLARAIWLAGAAGLIIATSLIVDDAPIWWRSSAPSDLPMLWNRAVLALAVGAGLGLALAVYPMLRHHATPPRPWEDDAIERRPRLVLQSTMDSVEPELDSLPPVVPTRASVQVGSATTAEPVGAGGATAAPGVREQRFVETEPVDRVGAAIARRRMAGYLAAGAVGALAGGGARVTVASPTAVPAEAAGPALSDVGARAIPFYGPHQAGIADPTRPQAHGWLAAFDLVAGVDRRALVALLRDWSEAAEALTAGRPVGVGDDLVVAGAGPSALTVTLGFGGSLFGRAGIPATARPAGLAPLPAFGMEQLDPARSGGDLGLIVAGDDPVVVAHASRVLTRLALGSANLRWQMSGFNSARGTSPDAATGRNLMGQLDGTNNPRPVDPDFASRVFVPDSDPASWLRGGSYVVVRRIRMLLDAWDLLTPHAQELVIGRRRDTGAPLTGGNERSAADFGARTPSGALVIPESAHMRLAAPAFNQGAAMLRRGFSYVDGARSGLLFVAWQADPRRGFIPVQQRLVGADALGSFIRHETSALFAAPRGVDPGGYLGQALVEG